MPMRRADLAVLGGCTVLAACAMLPAAQPDRPMFRDPGMTPQAAASTLAAGRSTQAQVAAQLGDADRLAFDNGYEVWVYRDRPVRAGQAELVLLFGPDGLLKKARLRPGDTVGTSLRRG
jgi:hypothetical protein